MRLRATSRTLLLKSRPSTWAQPRGVAVQLSKTFFSPSRRPAQLHNTRSDALRYDATQPLHSPEAVGFGGAPGGPLDERTIKLGKTLRILQERLPSILTSPLPTEILSPHISLHLFPSTHPHLPTVSGRVAYHAAMWFCPITWGRVPLLGNVKLSIVSERVVKNGPTYHSATALPDGAKPIGEKLIVKWKTCGKEGQGKLMLGKMSEWLGRDTGDGDLFTGLFIFEFDEQGRILSHVIERAEQSGNWDQGVGKFVALTDWLLGRLGRREDVQPELALGYVREIRKEGQGRRDR